MVSIQDQIRKRRWESKENASAHRIEKTAVKKLFLDAFVVFGKVDFESALETSEQVDTLFWLAYLWYDYNDKQKRWESEGVLPILQLARKIQSYWNRKALAKKIWTE